jgi:hypothetical protein
MILHRTDGAVQTMRVYSAFGGVSIEAVEFRDEDFEDLLALPPEQVREVLSILYMRFAPRKRK